MLQVELGRKSNYKFLPSQLPLESGKEITNNTLRIRREWTINRNEWHKIQTLALMHGFSSLSVLVSAFAEVLGRWSSGSKLTVIRIHDSNAETNSDEVFDRIISKPIISITFTLFQNEKWLDTCHRMELQLKDSIKQYHSIVPSVFSNAAKDADSNDQKVIITFSSRLSTSSDSVESNKQIGDFGGGEGDLHCCATKCEEGIKIIWDVFENSFSPGLSATMFDAYKTLLCWLSEGNWEKQIPDLLPKLQRQVRKQANSTYISIKEKCIHHNFFTHAQQNPERKALLWDEDGSKKIMTYGELADKALRLAAFLIKNGVKERELVAVTLPRGPNQVVAVLAVLAAGAAYVPVGVKQPAGRRDKIYGIGGIRYLVTDQAGICLLPTSQGCNVLLMEEGEQVYPLPCPILVSPDTLAYVIFTSGSTGEPKGVEITHGAAYNTILDINTRFSVCESDRILAVSALDFDLSVYDLFGLLSVGGGIVLLNESIDREAAVWIDLLHRMNVTVWNSVPALLEMLLSAAGSYDFLTSLRLVLTSGDWVGLDLQERLMKKNQDCRFIALGGATEASIWSNYFEVKAVDPSWSSIPYGKPLHNQCFRIVDKFGRECPDMVAGELWIGGMGVARGYLKNPELTARSFIHVEGSRWYCTGDLGRYWPDGNIEFLGRVDQQVKLRGYRIELGEIEAVLRQYEGVSQAIAVISSSGGTQHLAAAVVADSAPTHIYTLASTATNAGITSFRTSSREIQAKITEALILEILNLTALKNEMRNKLNSVEWVSEENQPLLQMWLCWLGERHVITKDDSGFHAGTRMIEVLQYGKKIKQSSLNCEEFVEENVITSVIGRRLFERLDIYRGILSGEISPAILLDDDILSPESLSSQDCGTIRGMELIANKIKQIEKIAGQPVKIALIGGRNGILAGKLLAMLDPADHIFTLLDSAASMVETARNHLSSLPHVVACQKLSEIFIPDQLRYSFDVVLAINSLHRYRDPEEGIALASLLVRRGGKIFALEHCELTPLATVTAAVLDRGFSNLNFDRRQAHSPMLPAQQWVKLLMKAGWHKVSFTSVEGSFTEFIEGTSSIAKHELDPDSILRFAKGYLPAHMMPEKITILPWLPLNGNGKVDRAVIVELFQSHMGVKGDEKTYEGMESQVAAMWKNLLDISSIGREQGFFEIGGDSLLATRFLAAVKEQFGIEFSLRQLIESPSLIEVAASLESKLTKMKATMESMEEGEI